jgi:flagellar hook-length control protein FliK
MSNLQSISTGQIKAQDLKNGSAAAPKPEETGDSNDPTFGLLLGPLLASLFQNVQQTPADAIKLNEGVSPAGKATDQTQDTNEPQQPTELSKLLLRIQNKDTAIETENTLAPQFSESLKNAKGNIISQEPAQKETAETKNTSADENAQSVQKDNDGKNVVDLLDKSEKHNSSLLRNVTVLDNDGKNDSGLQKAEPTTIVGPSKADSSTIVQQVQSSDLPAALHGAAAQSTGTGGSSASIRPSGVETTDAFDHAVSIVKDGNRLAVQLDHNGLGKLDINLSLDKGAVNAQINVADNATKKLIENNMQQIVNSILGDGVSVGGFSVSLKQQSNWDGSNQNQRNETRQRGEPEIQSVVAPSTNVVQGLINIFI